MLDQTAPAVTTPAAASRRARGGLAPAALEWLCAALSPGGRVVDTRRLLGGVSRRVDLVCLEAADGRRHDVVVGRYVGHHHGDPIASCTREFRLLGALAPFGFPAPRPLLLEADGAPFGAPTLVMTRLPGRPRLALGRLDVDTYLRRIAHLLADLHALPTAPFSFLPDQRTLTEASLAASAANASCDDDLHRTLIQTVAHDWPSVRAAARRRVLVHGDYWPGNLLWSRGRLQGLIDWEEPALGEPAQDVATCRSDLTLFFGASVADAFLAHYEAAVGRAVAHLRFWDLFVATWVLPEFARWADGWPALGRADLTVDQARARLKAFARANLARSPDI